MSTAPIQLGPFALHRIIGQGAMGDVWAGEHLGQAVPVAIKVLSRAGVWEPHHVERFRNEVKAVARLNHPGIVMVLDCGEVSHQISTSSGNRLTPGSPYLAMELAPYGSLDRLAQPLDWPTLKAVTLNILEALAHAHARGTIHRDIKPANVLITSRDNWPSSLKLTDFGIAQAAEDQIRAGTKELSVGTPNYMAPEQFEGLWRDYGPWTDLYALGCMVWELACGEVPFEADTFMVHAYKHLKAPLPALETVEPMPEGFEAWLGRLLEKRPRQRFQRAADAAWALQQLDSREVAGYPSLSLFAVDPTQTPHTDHRSMEWTQHPWEVEAGGGQPDTRDEEPPPTQLFNALRSGDPGGPMSMEMVALRPQDTPPQPETWRMDRPPTPSMRLVGAGLGLYGLRTVPMVGRKSQRDALWSALDSLRTLQRPRLVLIRGLSGVGKSRLARWFCERAHEVGAAEVLKAFHSPMHGPGDGLPRMVARHLRCTGLERSQILARVERLLRREGVEDDYQWHGLTEFIAPTRPEERASLERHIEFSTPSEWYVLIQELLARTCQSRPAIVWLDDVQWGADALGLAEHLMAARHRAPMPVLVLLTAREEALAERPMERLMLDRLMEDPHAHLMDLPPLTDEESTALVSELLCLEGELAGQVSSRSGGNPLFAVQIVGDWVQRGVLEVGERGFVLRPGERALLPDDIHQIMAARVAQQLHGRSSDDRRALEIAALLGQEFDEREWRQACALEHLRPPPDLLDGLMLHDLLHPIQSGWVFTHGMLRESIVRTAEEHDRVRAGHMICARALQRLYPEGTRGISERVGLHYLNAGDLEQALLHLRQAAAEHILAGDYGQAAEVLNRRQQGLRDLALPEEDPRWGEGELMRARVLKHQGRLEESRALSRRLEQQARRHGWGELLPSALQNTGDVARIQGDMHQAASIYQLACDLYQLAGDPRGLASVLFGMADVRCQTGDLKGARELFDRVWEMNRDMALPNGMAECLCGLGRVAAQLDDLPRAGSLFHRALKIFEQHGGRSQTTDCLKSLADVARYQGQHPAAEAGYRRALDFHEASGSGEAVHTRLALGLLYLHRDEPARARPILEACRRVFEQTGERDDLGRVHAQLLPCAAEAEDWDAWDHHVEQARTCLQETARFDRDIAWPAQRGGDIARLKGQPRRALAAYGLALAQWRTSGQLGRAAEVELAMAAISHA